MRQWETDIYDPKNQFRKNKNKTKQNIAHHSIPFWIPYLNVSFHYLKKDRTVSFMATFLL